MIHLIAVTTVNLSSVLSALHILKFSFFHLMDFIIEEKELFVLMRYKLAIYETQNHQKI